MSGLAGWPPLAEFVGGGLLLVALAFAGWVGLARLDRRTDAVVGVRVRAGLDRPRPAVRALRFVAVAVGAIAAVGIAIAPMQRFLPVDDARGAADCVIVLDVSRSMSAEDVAPSRLERARALVHELVAMRSDARFALITFAGDARMVVPLTRDHASFRELLDEVDPNAQRRGGTEFALALETALAALVRTRAADVPASIVLISDGEDLGWRGAEAARACARSGVTVSCVGLGSELGAKIPLPAERPGDPRTFLRDAAGNDVVTAFDARGLDAIARAGGGRFVDGNGELAGVVQATGTQAIPTADGSADVDRTRDVSAIVLVCALIACAAWWLEAALAERSLR
ncbi:MAG: VWA domain-containing protein [Planctomycetes bacterium]|nr:VWA domain-containing protein [Planctomycetota bacterium]